MAIISNSLQFASALKGIRLRKLLFLYISGSVRCHFQVLRSSWYLQMCTCKLSLSYLSWENMQIWNLRFPAFVAPYKRAEFATFASAGNSRKALLPRQLKVTSSEEVQSIRDVSNFVILSQFNVTWYAYFPWICIVCAFVALHVFTTVRCYRRDGA